MSQTPSTSDPESALQTRLAMDISESIHLPAFSEDEESLYEELRVCLALARTRFGTVREIEFRLKLTGNVPRSSVNVSLGSKTQRSRHYDRIVKSGTG